MVSNEMLSEEYLLIDSQMEMVCESVIQEGLPEGVAARLVGTFAIIDNKGLNSNARRYTRENYQKCIDQLQPQIDAKALFGEFEHQDRQFVPVGERTHRIDWVKWDESGSRFYGQISLMDNDKIRNQILPTIKMGSPIYISSRAIGKVDPSTRIVTLRKIITWDIVSQAGFPEAQLHMAINESLGFGDMDNMLFLKYDPEQGINEDNNKGGNNLNSSQIMELKEQFKALLKDKEFINECKREGLFAHLMSEDSTMTRENIVEIVNESNQLAYKQIDAWTQKVFYPNLNKRFEKFVNENMGNGTGISMEKVEEMINESKSELLGSLSKLNTDYINEHLLPSIEKHFDGEYRENIINESKEFVEEVQKKIGQGLDNFINEELYPELDKRYVNESKSENYTNEEEFRKGAMQLLKNEYGTEYSEEEGEKMIKKVVESMDEESDWNKAMDEMKIHIKEANKVNESNDVKGKRVKITSTDYKGEEGLIISNDLQDGQYQVQMKDEKVRGFKPDQVEFINEANDGDGKVENEAEFRSYAKELLKEMHGDKYDEKIAKESIDGLVEKYGGDNKWGDAIGAIQGSGVNENAEEEAAKKAAEAKAAEEKAQAEADAKAKEEAAKDGEGKDDEGKDDEGDGVDESAYEAFMNNNRETISKMRHAYDNSDDPKMKEKMKKGLEEMKKKSDAAKAKDKVSNGAVNETYHTELDDAATAVYDKADYKKLGDKKHIEGIIKDLKITKFSADDIMKTIQDNINESKEGYHQSEEEKMDEKKSADDARNQEKINAWVTKNKKKISKLRKAHDATSDPKEKEKLKAALDKLRKEKAALRGDAVNESLDAALAADENVKLVDLLFDTDQFVNESYFLGLGEVSEIIAEAEEMINEDGINDYQNEYFVQNMSGVHKMIWGGLPQKSRDFVNECSKKEGVNLRNNKDVHNFLNKFNWHELGEGTINESLFERDGRSFFGNLRTQINSNVQYTKKGE